MLSKYLAEGLCLFWLMSSVYAIDEITSQDVPFGDYIKQYAVVQTVENGAVSNEFCKDCAAYITLTDEKNVKKVNNVSMVSLSSGLFGHKSTGLIVGKSYNVRVETISPVYGRGIVYSKANIVPASSRSEISLSSDSTSSILPSFLEDYLKDISASFGVIKTAVNMYIDNVTNTFKAFGLLKGIISVFWNFALWVGKALYLFVSSETRGEAYSMVFEGFLGIIWSIMSFFLPFILILEVFILAKCSTMGGINPLLAFMEENYRLLDNVVRLFRLFFDVFMDILDGIVKLVSFVIPWGGG
jgi:hypothetical protein